jgi:hypothetical protein
MKVGQSARFFSSLSHAPGQVDGEGIAAPVGPVGRRTVFQAAAALALFLGLAVFHTWPLATSPATLSRNDNSDAILNQWIMAWVADRLPRDPLNLFNANIFHPEPNTLAFSEHLFIQSIMGAPLQWAGFSPVLVHNLVLILGLALTAWTMCLVMKRWTGDWMAGLLTGAAFSFNAHTLTRLAHIQAVHVEFLPLAVLAFDRLLVKKEVKYALLLAAFFALQGLASNYILVFMTLGLAAAFLVRPEDWSRALPSVVPLLFLAAILAVLALLPFLLPYYQAREMQGLMRGLDDARGYAASGREYLMTGGRLHFATWSHRFWAPSEALFPGLTVLALAAVAIFSRTAFKDVRARMWLAIAAIGLAMSFGPLMPGYSLLYSVFPLLQGIRVVVRFGHLFLLGLAVLAGFGLVTIRRQWKGRRLAAALSVAAIVLVTVEAARAPVGYTAAENPPQIYRLFAAEPEAVIVEFPFFQPREFFRNAQYMLNSTLHWRPLVNGYSGFRPESYDEAWRSLRDFPEGDSLYALRQLGVTHVVVHVRPFGWEHGWDKLSLLDDVPALRRMVQARSIWIYRLQFDDSTSSPSETR